MPKLRSLAASPNSNRLPFVRILSTKDHDLWIQQQTVAMASATASGRIRPEHLRACYAGQRAATAFSTVHRRPQRSSTGSGRVEPGARGGVTNVRGISGQTSQFHMNILIVDDQPIDLKLLGAILEAEGYTRHAADGIEALELLESRGADVIISDILMPRMDG